MDYLQNIDEQFVKYLQEKYQRKCSENNVECKVKPSPELQKLQIEL